MPRLKVFYLKWEPCDGGTVCVAPRFGGRVAYCWKGGDGKYWYQLMKRNSVISTVGPFDDEYQCRLAAEHAAAAVYNPTKGHTGGGRDAQ